MKKYHTTQGGDKMLIAQMDDDHLKNTIGVYCKRIKSQIEMVDKFSTLKESEKILYGFTKTDVNITEKASQEINSAASGMAAYVVEAALRGLDVSRHLQDAYGRIAKIPVFETKALSTEVIIEPFDPTDDTPF